MLAVSGIIDFRTPAAGFDQPIQMWLACHERILRMLALLLQLRDHLANDGAIESAQVTAASILRYFAEAAPRHHEDEELDLFPPLLRLVAAEERNEVAKIVNALTAEHVQLDRAWMELRPLLVAIDAGARAQLDERVVAHFVDRYQQHIQRENDKLTPAFQCAFDASTMEAIGGAMAARRGVDWKQLRSAS
ncbi:MAG TPA: hemerythrin domain-containing protein [Burkholderiaceae bacterium]|nr:hemerythrin domain-containing protein [Burkholderiaceae bacterium]